MASSSSSGKNVEKQQSKPTSRAPQHMSLPKPAVERLKEIQNWAEKYWLTYNEEKIRHVNEIQENMNFNDLLSYVMYGDGEEVVWTDDVLNVQSITKVPEYQEAKRIKTEAKGMWQSRRFRQQRNILTKLHQRHLLTMETFRVFDVLLFHGIICFVTCYIIYVVVKIWIRDLNSADLYSDPNG